MIKADKTLEGAQIRVVPGAAQGAFSSQWLRYHVCPRFAPALIVFLFALTVWVAVGRGNTPVPADDWVVVVPVANMYSSASEQTDVVSQAVLGNHVVVFEARGEWANVRTPDQYTGWMPRSELRKVNKAGATRLVQVESLFANLYQEADVTMHRPVLTVPFESRLEVLGEGKGDDVGWLKVRLPDGRDAWIQSSDVITEPKPLTIEESIALAKRFLGLPYLWGGRSSYGYDCSGFTQMLVRSRGINMPRDADLQAAWEGMEVIDRKVLRPGDLLFFGAGPEKITHTAMYIGDGEIIHATTHEHPVVQISKLDDQPWTRILVACRRIK